MEELVEMAKKLKDATHRGEDLGLRDDEVRFAAGGGAGGKLGVKLRLTDPHR